MVVVVVVVVVALALAAAVVVVIVMMIIIRGLRGKITMRAIFQKPLDKAQFRATIRHFFGRNLL